MTMMRGGVPYRNVRFHGSLTKGGLLQWIQGLRENLLREFGDVSSWVRGLTDDLRVD